MRLIKAFFALATGWWLTACQSNDSATSADDGHLIATTTGMITDVTRQLAAEHALVEGIIGEGIDPHLYQPAISDVKLLDSADLIFYNGLQLEGKMQDIFERLAAAGKPVHAVTDGFPADRLIDGDPHLWMDVAAWTVAAEAIAAKLVAFDPEHAESYEENLASYRSELTKLDDYARSVLGSVPAERRILVTAHDAFSYMARAYDFEVRGIQGISTESEAGLRDIRELIDVIVEREIPAVFVETSVSDKSVLALIEGAAARGHQLVIGGQLYSDAMGPAGSYEGTYIGMIDHNVTTIARALGGEAPARGMQGKLAP